MQKKVPFVSSGPACRDSQDPRGGLPEFSFNLLAGTRDRARPRSRTSSCSTWQIGPSRALFHGARRAADEDAALSAAVRILQREQIEKSLRFVNLASELLRGDLSRVLKAILQEVEGDRPAWCSSTRFARSSRDPGQSGGETELQHFVQDLGMHLTAGKRPRS